jgi:HEPN domain-containing protein
MQWVRKADDDRNTAINLSTHQPSFRDQACFHAQQAAEKYLKALLQERGVSVPRTQDLELILTLLLPHDNLLRPLSRAVAQLSRFAVEFRYPGKRATTRQMQSALQNVEKVRTAVRSRLGF